MSMVDRFTSIIDAFDDAEVGLSLDQIAARAALPRSTTHRILDHLVRLNWLAHNDRGYRLGTRAQMWGAGDAADLRLREAAGPVLHDLHVLTAAVVHLGVLDGDHIVHVDKLGGASAAAVPTRVGSRWPAVTTAIGQAVLAASSPTPGGVVVRKADYAIGLTSVAVAVDRRAAVGIVLPGKVNAHRYGPLVGEAACRIRAVLG